MIKGIGTDIIEIERIQKAIERTPKFLDKMLSSQETRLYVGQKIKVETVAGSFAAKEAMSKALGTGFRGFEPKDISVLRNEQGKPYIQLHGKAKEIADSQQIKKIFVSISHCKHYATATVIVEGN